MKVDIQTIRQAIGDLGLDTQCHQDRHGVDIWTLVAVSDAAPMDLMAKADGPWEREEWLLAFVGMTLGLVNRAGAREIARSWAIDKAPDEAVLPGFLVWD